MKSRKGLSTVIGAVFFVIIFSSSIAYVAYSMDLIDTLSKSVGVKQSLEIDRANEEFEITKVQLVNNKFNITVQNIGNIPINITRLWTENVTATDWVSKHDINKIVTPGVTTTNIGQNIALTALDTVGYDMKLVTERGTVNTFSINSVNQAPLDLKFHALPDLVPTGFTTILLLTVRNDLPNSNLLLNLEPNDLGVSSVCEQSLLCSESKVSGPFPTSIDILRPGDIGTFKWIYQLNGRVDDIWTFTGSLKNGVAGNTVTVTSAIQEIESSNIAGQSLSTLGLSADIFQADVLVFHDEVASTPGGSYQMDVLEPNGPGLVITQNSGSGLTTFFSKEIIEDDMNIPAGLWNASLRYNSERFSSAMSAGADDIWQDGTDGGHIFHFNEGNTPILDSVADATCYNLASSGAAGTFGATWGSTFGVNASGGYYFGGDGDHIVVDDAGGDKKCNRPEKQLFSLAGWFNATSKASDAKQFIWDKQDVGDDDFIELHISDGTAPNHGVVFFNWHTEKTGSTELLQCDSSSDGKNYMDDEWHHFVAIREFSAVGSKHCTCRLYIDGVSVDNDDKGAVCDQGAGGGKMKAQGDVYIGSNSTGAQGFEGYLDNIMFWNDYEPTSSDVTALKETLYGIDAHKIDLIIDHTDENGTKIANLVTTNSFLFPFKDQKHETDKQILWLGANFTANIGNVTLSELTGDRLNFTMKYNDGLDMRFLIDDGTLSGTGSIISSYLQPPEADRGFVAYLQFHNTDDVVLFIYNQGSVGTWLTYQGTRIVFTNNTNIDGFAGLIKSINGTAVDEDADSLYIPADAKAELTFWPPQEIPKAAQPGEPLKIPAGQWDAYVFISGYTEQGKTFLKTVAIGKIDVLE